ncbi:MAG: UvrB/UvrC motif-containing protein, partial [Planctomycetia bacterium]
MKCEKCAEKAVIHMTEIEEGGDFSEVHLCYHCAQDHLRQSTDEDEPAPVKNPTKESAKSSAVVALTPQAGAAVCPVCGISFADFRATGRLGCPNDYQVFHEELKPLLENIHGALRHVGKSPRRLPADVRGQAEL